MPSMAWGENMLQSKVATYPSSKSRHAGTRCARSNGFEPEQSLPLQITLSIKINWGDQMNSQEEEANEANPINGPPTISRSELPNRFFRVGGIR